MDEVERLGRRLADQGLRPVARLRVTENRTVMVSLSRKRVLSVHRGFAAAPDGVLQAIVRFVSPGATRDMRKIAQREILSYHASAGPAVQPPQRRCERPLPGDAEAIAKLDVLFSDYNGRHFLGALPRVPIRLSGRMRTRLGHLSLADDGRPTEITISRRHLAEHGWDEVGQTLLHEMVHLWQCATGQRVDHGPAFRARARQAGVAASARRWVRKPRRPRQPALAL
jgi:hypothetical protein